MSRVGFARSTPIALRFALSVDNLLWVANTRHGPGGHWFARVRDDPGDHDHLRDPADAREYLDRHRVPLPDGLPDEETMARLRTIRDSVRGLVEPGAPDWTPGALALLEHARYVLSPDGGLRSDAAGWPGFVADLLVPLRQLLEARAALRICGNPHCRLVFLDISRNGSRRWCDTRGCGNRDRVARHRGRPREDSRSTQRVADAF